MCHSCWQNASFPEQPTYILQDVKSSSFYEASLPSSDFFFYYKIQKKGMFAVGSCSHQAIFSFIKWLKIAEKLAIGPRSL